MYTKKALNVIEEAKKIDKDLLKYYDEFSGNFFFNEEVAIEKMSSIMAFLKVFDTTTTTPYALNYFDSLDEETKGYYLVDVNAFL